MRKILLIVPVLFLCACSTSQKARFYLLEPVTELALEAEPKTTIIELSVAKIPGYLDRPQIVTRDQNQQVEINEYQRWAEPLQETFTRVLAANLNHKISTAEFVQHKALMGSKADYRLLVTLLRFDSDKQTADVLLKADWRLQKTRDKNKIQGHTEKIMVPARDKSFSGRVRGHSQAIAQLAERIAAKIAILP